jgi:hypothetical protein
LFYFKETKTKKINQYPAVGRQKKHVFGSEAKLAGMG